MHATFAFIFLSQCDRFGSVCENHTGSHNPEPHGTQSKLHLLRAGRTTGWRDFEQESSQNPQQATKTPPQQQDLVVIAVFRGFSSEHWQRVQ